MKLCFNFAVTRKAASSSKSNMNHCVREVCIPHYEIHVNYQRQLALYVPQHAPASPTSTLFSASCFEITTTITGMRLKNSTGFSVTIIFSSGITGQSPSLGFCVVAKVCHSTISFVSNCAYALIGLNLGMFCECALDSSASQRLHRMLTRRIQLSVQISSGPDSMLRKLTPLRMERRRISKAHLRILVAPICNALDRR